MKFHRRKRSAPVITIVSLIDILTILLIFFIVSTTFKTQQTQVEINLPDVKSAVQKVAEAEPAELSIKSRDQIFLEGKPISVADTGAAVKKLQDAKRPVALKVDKDSPAGVMFEVLDSLKTAKVENLPALTREQR